MVSHHIYRMTEQLLARLRSFDPIKEPRCSSPKCQKPLCIGEQVISIQGSKYAHRRVYHVDCYEAMFM